MQPFAASASRLFGVLVNLDALLAFATGAAVPSPVLAERVPMHLSHVERQAVPHEKIPDFPGLGLVLVAQVQRKPCGMHRLLAGLAAHVAVDVGAQIGGARPTAARQVSTLQDERAGPLAVPRGVVRILPTHCRNRA